MKQFAVKNGLINNKNNKLNVFLSSAGLLVELQALKLDL